MQSPWGVLKNSCFAKFPKTQWKMSMSKFSYSKVDICGPAALLKRTLTYIVFSCKIPRFFRTTVLWNPVAEYCCARFLIWVMQTRFDTNNETVNSIPKNKLSVCSKITRNVLIMVQIILLLGKDHDQVTFCSSSIFIKNIWVRAFNPF